MTQEQPDGGVAESVGTLCRGEGGGSGVGGGRGAPMPPLGLSQGLRVCISPETLCILRSGEFCFVCFYWRLPHLSMIGQ